MTEESAAGGRLSRHRSVVHAFHRSVGLTALGTLIPGAGLIHTKYRRLGWALVSAFVVGVVAALTFVLVKGPKDAALALATNSTLLTTLAVLAIGLGLLWCASILLTARTTRPAGLDWHRSAVHAGFAALMVVVIAVPAWWVETNTKVTDDTLRTVFAGRDDGNGITLQTEEPDPWIGTPRVNVLLIGSDAGVGREGVRTDSMIVASVDTTTGDTVMFGLPRNLQRVPIPKDNPLYKTYPNGYYCPDRVAQYGVGETCMLNGVWEEAVNYHLSEFSDPASAGRTTTRDVVGEVLGLRIDYTVVINLQGFQDLVDAMGGVDINVKVPANDYGWTSIPIGAHPVNGRIVEIPDANDKAMWIQPGRQHLNGFQALWYARTRALDSDFGRMKRQRCVVGALVQQVNPAVMVQKYQAIAKAAMKNVYTDISRDELPAFVTLVEKIQGAKITSLPFTDFSDGSGGNISTARPDFSAIRAMVQRAIATPATPTSSGTSTTSPQTTTSPTTPTGKPTTSTGTGTPTTAPTTPTSVNDAC